MTRKTTLNPAEIDQFAKDSPHWWDENGPFAPLHALNPIRMKFMVEVLEQQGVAVAKGMGVLDVGCGGGLVAEPFARLGARVVGVDGDAGAVRVARDHAAQMGLTIDYRVGAVEDVFPDDKSVFDVITALEIIEHVDNPDVFLAEVAARVRPGGIIFVSTLNRTLKSLVLGKVIAEYVVGWVPRGTHDPRKFVKPSELAAMMDDVGCVPVAATGLCYDPLRRVFYADPHDLQVNYMMAFVKNKKSR
jgi:2-polyprenyl-6-hydroxyphenyl methylase / 3-demethylubiquinone-9 3-methyltransferase